MDEVNHFWQGRLVRYADLVPCTNAFIDARSPGSDRKENFTIIGPGVAENPHQYVHISEAHGFNIGGARQPPHCTNSQHSHDTAEVFIIYSGTWRFVWGEFADAGEVVLEPGDTISIPIHVFRGFENIGDDVGFMFSVLGGDDPGRVHWAPHVIEKARNYGLALLDNGQLVDTKLGESVPSGRVVVEPSAPHEIDYIRVPTGEEMYQRITSKPGLDTSWWDVAPHAPGVREAPIIGGRTIDGVAPAPIHEAHGFTVRSMFFEKNAQLPLHSRACTEVWIVTEGALTFSDDVGVQLTVAAGDTLTIPVGRWRSFSSNGVESIAYVVRGGDDPGVWTWR
ncbi:cupin domain-containing protein [Paraburkholderia nemoris]|uniref:cupin domain-containing protein n=1 Tax=Paraburkholderia nemoris TaxID=2793076 RepID=UPI0038BC9489